ncbi:MAG: alpha/beta hydrolase family protein [Acidimicrobiales bacterium]
MSPSTSSASSPPLTLREPPAALVLTPGASADRDHATLVALDAGLPELTVERLTLGTTSVKSAVRKIVAAGTELAGRLGVEPGRIMYGGRSFGGRACSVAVAQGLPAAGLALLSYPLHPPGKPDKLRVDHFGELTVPSLFVSGEKDPFGSADEFAKHLAAITGPVRFESIPGNHAPKGQDDAIVSLVRSFLHLD